MIELKTYAGSNVTPQNDAIMNDTNTLNNGIYYGCNVTIKDATTLHINAGQGIVYGRLFEVLDSDIPVSLSPSGTLLGQLYVHIDLSNIAAPIQILVDTGETLANLEDDPQLNIDSGITDMQLATFTVSTVGISDLVETFKAVEPIRAVLGDADISAIGDGTVKGSIRTINTHFTWKAGTASGKNATIPNDCNEVCIRGHFVRNGAHNYFAFTLPKIAVPTSGSMAFGPYTDLGSYWNFAFGATTITLSECRVDGTSYINDADIAIWYR